ncbi:MAG TPA: YCF48-related protein [Candidatus Limnocylindrales bacterium]
MDDLDARLRRRLAALADAAAHEEPVPLGTAAVRPIRRGGRTQSALPVGALGLVAVLVVALVAIAPRLVGGPAFVPSEAASHSPTSSVVTSVAASPTASAPAVPEKPSPLPGESPSPTASPVPDAERFSASAVAFFDRQHGLIGGDSAGQGVIWRTDDGGLTYEKQLVPTPGILAIAVTGTAEAWAGAPTALLHSADAGRTWQKISSVELGSVSFVDSRRGWGIQTGDIATGVKSGELVSTIDGGRTWAPGAAPCDYNGAVSVSFVDALHGWAGCSWPAGAGQGPKGISATTDGGRTWRLVAADPLPPGPVVGQISITGYLTGGNAPLRHRVLLG